MEASASDMLAGTSASTALDAEAIIKHLTLENAELRAQIERLTTERDELAALARLQKSELERLLGLQKTPRERVDTDEVQLFFEAFEKELQERVEPTDDASDSLNDLDGQDGGKGGKGGKPRSKHGRRPLPTHLPVQTVTLSPAQCVGVGKVVHYEESWKLGYRRGGWFRLRVLRPVYAVPEGLDVETSNIVAQASDVEDAPCALVRDEHSCAGAVWGMTAGMAELHASDVVSECTASPWVTHGHCSTVVFGGAHMCVPPLHAVHVSRPKMVAGATTLACAAMPDEILPRALATCSVLAHIVVSKFLDCLPLHRQESIFRRNGLRISRGTMCDWLELAYPLVALLMQAWLADAKAHAHVIGVDATGVWVQAKERCKRGHFWAFVVDRTYIIYRYTPNHTSEEPISFFKGYSGIVLADAASIYDALFNQEDGPDEAGCWSHGRRYWIKALTNHRELALIGIGFCNKLFAIERKLVNLPADRRLVLRQRHSRHVVDLMYEWMQSISEKAQADTPVARALTYFTNQKHALTKFLEDGNVRIHNNDTERALRNLVVGRANWLFLGSDDTGESSAAYMSLCATAKLHGLEPEAYVRDLFRVLPFWPKHRLVELAPHRWVATRARLDPYELELELGPLTVPPAL